MKTTTAEVKCDGCGKVIPTLSAHAIFVTMRGPQIGHKKLDCCGLDCLELAVLQFINGRS